MADAVLIMQSLANPSKYKIPENCKDRADVYQKGTGITNMDALEIQKYMVGLVDTLEIGK